MKPYVFAIFFLGMSIFFTQNVFAGKEASVQEYFMPTQGGDASSVFSGVGINRKTGKVWMVKRGGRIELSQQNGTPMFDDLSTGSTQGLDLTAAAGGPEGVYVYDRLSNSIMEGKRSYRIQQNISNVVGMTYCQGRIYLADKGSGKIFAIELRGSEGYVVGEFIAPEQTTGLASDGESLFASSWGKVVRLDQAGNILDEYDVNRAMSGLAWVGGKVFIASDTEGKKIYRIELQ